jgi:microcystin-dependent protein
MSELSPIFELDELQSLSAGMDPTYHHLSETTRLLCLDLLSRWPTMRWAWRNDGETLTAEEWDEAEAMVDQAAQELIKTMLTGAIFPFAGETIPAGFLLCDGAAVSREEYADLFAVIGVTYGSGNGSTTFNLPDLRGRVPVGLDAEQGEFEDLGQNGGETTHTLTNGELPIIDLSHSHGEITAIAVIVNGGVEAPAASAIPGLGSTGSAGGSIGGGEAHNNLQPYLTLNFIIKT